VKCTTQLLTHIRSHNSQDSDLGCLEATGWAQESLASVALPMVLYKYVYDYD